MSGEEEKAMTYTPNTDTEETLLQGEDVQEKQKWYHIDTDMIPVKLCYLLINMKDSCYIPYLNLYLPSVGVPLKQAGIITGTRLIGFLCGSPVWGMVADKWNRLSALLSLLCAMSVLLMLPQPFIAASLHPKTSQVSCRPGNESIMAENRTTTNSTRCLQSNDEGLSTQFWFHFVINIIMMFFDGATIGLNDSAVSTIIKHSPKKIDFGRQRLFGAIGFALGSLVTSLFIDIFGKAFPTMSKYSPMFFVYSSAMLLYIVSSYWMSKQMPSKSTKSKEKNDLLRALWATIKKFNVSFFLAITFIAGFGNGLHLGFCFKLLDEMSAPKILMGVTVTTGAIGAIILFNFSTIVINTLRGTFPAFAAVLLAYSVRFLVYTFARNPYVIVASQVLQCACYALFLAAAFLHTKLVSKTEVQSTMFSIMNSLHFGAGFMMANLIGGVVYEIYGRKILFLGSTILSVIWFCMVLIYIIVQKNQRLSNADIERSTEIKELTAS